MMLKKKTALSLNEWKVEWLKEEIRTQKLMNAREKAIRRIIQTQVSEKQQQPRYLPNVLQNSRNGV